MDITPFLATVAFISLSGVMMPGPVFAVTIAKAYTSKKAGTLIALGHGAIEIPLIILLYYGLSEIFTLTPVQKTVGLLGGLILTYMGVQTFKNRKNVNVKPQSSKHTSFIAGLTATAANPYFYLWWATVGTALIFNAALYGLTGITAFAAVHWLCDLAWYSLVSATVYKSRRFWTNKIFNTVFLTCAAILTAFGLWFIISTLFI